MIFTSDTIESRLPDAFEYSDTESLKRFTYFMEMYQNTSFVEIPSPLIEELDIPDDEYWLQTAAYNAHTTLMDCLAGLCEITSRKVENG